MLSVLPVRQLCCAAPCSPYMNPEALGSRRGPTSGDLANDPHGYVCAGAQTPHAIAALDPVAAVLAKHAGPRVVLAPVGVVHGSVVMPNQGATW